MAKYFDPNCYVLAEHFLEDGAAEALKDALAREFQQVADDFRAELQVRQNTHDDIDHTAHWRAERRRSDYDPFSREYENEILK